MFRWGEESLNFSLTGYMVNGYRVKNPRGIFLMKFSRVEKREKRGREREREKTFNYDLEYSLF